MANFCDRLSGHWLLCVGLVWMRIQMSYKTFGGLSISTDYFPLTFKYMLFKILNTVIDLTGEMTFSI